MPFKSDAQRRFFHSPGAKKAGITDKEVNEFDQASKGMKLPERKMAEGGEVAPKGDEFMEKEKEGFKNGINGDWESIKKSISDYGNKMHENYIKSQGDNGTLKGVGDIMRKNQEPQMAMGGDVPSDMDASDTTAYMLGMGQAPSAQPNVPMNPWMQGAAEQAAAPVTPQPWMQPPQQAPDADFIAKLNAGMNTNPTPNPIMQASKIAQSTAPTAPSIYQGMTAADRAALMQKLIAQKSSAGMLAAKGAAGLGDAITSAFGKTPTNAMGNLRDTEAKNIEQRIGAVDTERQQKLQDLQASQEQSLNDPNSSLSQSMRTTLKAAGMNVPSGMSGAIILKIAGPLGEMAMKQATLAETANYHKGELGQQTATREEKADVYRSEHPFLNWLNPIGNEHPTSPVSNRNIGGHGVPDLGSTFNGEKVIGVKRIK